MRKNSEEFRFWDWSEFSGCHSVVLQILSSAIYMPRISYLAFFNIPYWLSSSTHYVSYLPVDDLDSLKGLYITVDAYLNTKIYFLHTKMFINGNTYKVTSILLEVSCSVSGMWAFFNDVCIPIK